MSKKGMSREDFDKQLKTFIDYTCDQLDIKQPPKIRYKEDGKDGEQPSFGGYAPHSKELIVYTKNRHPMDIFRTVAHELVHHKQNEDGRLGKDIAKEGATGSKIENEANSVAGQVMRYFGRENPFYFDMSYVAEHKAIILGGTPGSGKDKILKEAILPFGFREVSGDKLQFNENIVVTGSFTFRKIKQIKEQLERNGYETMLVFVNTSDDVSRQRNEQRGHRGGRVISEMVRFAKWQDAQDILQKCSQLFEKFHVFLNDNDSLSEQYGNNLHFLKKNIHQFALNEADYKFETMLNEVGGAGNFGTDNLRIVYQKMTPGQEGNITTPSGKKVRLTMKYKKPKITKPNPMPKSSVPHLALGAGDRIGTELGLPKGPTMGAPFDDTTSMGISPPYGISDPIARWMVKEETKKRFKEKYGALAEKKLRETANRLKEALYDPTIAGQGATPNSGNYDDIMPDANVPFEKTSLFGKNKSRKNFKRTK